MQETFQQATIHHKLRQMVKDRVVHEWATVPEDKILAIQVSKNVEQYHVMSNEHFLERF
jgi:hypothetical protein